MTEATSCGGVVIFRGKILVLYKSYRNRYEGWVLPKGTVEAGETFPETALREVHEETGTQPKIVKYVGQSQYTFNVTRDSIRKTVHWYLMEADSYYSKPQREEYLVDSGYYKYHEAYHLLKFSNEKMILETAYRMYQELKRTPGSDVRACRCWRTAWESSGIKASIWGHLSGKRRAESKEKLTEGFILLGFIL